MKYYFITIRIMIFKKKENKNIIESLLEEPNKEDNVKIF